MAGKVSAKGLAVSIDDSAGTPRVVSTDIVSYEIEQDSGKVDVTGFAEGSVNYIPGLPVQGIAMEGMWNTTASTGLRTVLQSILGSSTSKTISLTPESGGPAFSGEFMLDGFNVSGSPAEAIRMVSIHFSPMGGTAAVWA